MTEFSDLVREAFIDPLRSVLIVDDQYPTWEEILNSHKLDGEKNDELDRRSVKKHWRKEPDNTLKVIKQFRSQKPGLVIDIHDALAPSRITDDNDEYEETPKQLADHLHQSDLLVLDYNLEGSGAGLRGEKAREILRSVLSNNHFNLIIVHTGENNLEEVMAECLISLMESCTSKLSTSESANLDALAEELDDLEAGGEFNRDALKDVFTMSDYLFTRQSGHTSRSLLTDYMKGQGKLKPLNNLGQSVGLTGGRLKNFLLWAIRNFEKNRLETFSKVAPKSFEWENSPNSKWLRTARGFVCFIKKGPEDLLKELQASLVNWKPTPSRLLSAKYRHELNRTGVEAEDDALLRKYVFAHFYQSIRRPVSENLSEPQANLLRTFRLKEHVSRQSESLSFLIENQLVDFGNKIIDADEAAGNHFSEHYGVDLSDEKEEKKAIAHYNSYVSTLPHRNVSADQLDSGHIFKAENEWWVCATPACDMQPGQNSIAFVGNSDKLRPFTALQLQQVKPDELAPDHITTGSYCFVEYDGKIIGLGLRTLEKEKEPATQKVTWRTFIAEEAGLIRDGTFEIFQLKLNDEQIEPEKTTATIITKLRYEYALNYIQRVGTSVSRIGLDYATYKKK